MRLRPKSGFGFLAKRRPALIVTAWSIERELCDTAGADDLMHALLLLRLLKRGETFVALEELQPWTRAGAETYTYVFRVRTVASAKQVLVKACVALGGTSVGEICQEWLRRRRFLQSAGISTPELYGFSRATIIEEYVAMTLPEAFLLGNLNERLRLASGLGRLVGVLSRYRFQLLSLHDLRSRADDVVVIDFGEDLGPPFAMSTENPFVLDRALEDMAHDGVHLTPHERTKLTTAFEFSLVDPAIEPADPWN